MIERCTQMPPEHVTGIRALIVESDPHVAAQVRAVLARDGAIARMAASAGGAMALAGEYPPDVLVVDLGLGGGQGGINLAVAMKRRWRLAIVFLARELSPSALEMIAAIEAAEIVRKPIDRRQLEAALRLAIQRHATVSRRGGDSSDGDAYWLERLAVLRPREREVACLLRQSRVPAIAAQLGISPHTVRNHLKGAFKRTGTRSQQDLLDWLRQHAERRPDGAIDMTHSGYLGAQGGVDYQPASGSGVDTSVAHTEAERQPK